MTNPDKILEDKKNVKDDTVGVVDLKIQADLESRKSKESLIDKINKLKDSDKKVLESFIDRMSLQKKGGKVSSSEDVLKKEDIEITDEEFETFEKILKQEILNIKDTLTEKKPKIQKNFIKNPSIRKVNLNTDGKPFSVNIENKSPWAHGTPSLEELQSVKDKVDVDFILQKVNKEKTLESLSLEELELEYISSLALYRQLSQKVLKLEILTDKKRQEELDKLKDGE